MTLADLLRSVQGMLRLLLLLGWALGGAGGKELDLLGDFATVPALKQPHDLSAFVLREGWRDEAVKLDKMLGGADVSSAPPFHGNVCRRRPSSGATRWSWCWRRSPSVTV